jgi:hypothetical protein
MSHGHRVERSRWVSRGPQWVRTWDHRMDGTWEMIAELLSTWYEPYHGIREPEELM